MELASVTCRRFVDPVGLQEGCVVQAAALNVCGGSVV